jgi:ribonuclease P protein component
LPKVFRVRRRRDFLLAARSGIFATSGAVVIQCAENGEKHFRVGFTASRRVGNAVVRNRCKRRMRALAGALLEKSGLEGIDYIFIAKKTLYTMPWADLVASTQKSISFLHRRLGKCAC